MMRLIDANKLLGDIKTLPIMSNWGEAFILHLVQEQPTVDTVPAVYARWVDGKCSNCGVDIPTDDAHDAIFESECHFCYSCGAKMQEA